MDVAAADDMTSQQNVTSLVDTSLTLHCPLAAAKHDSPRTTWQKRDDDGTWRPVPRDRGRITLPPDDSGDLEFNRLLVSDAGFYRCSKTTVPGVDNHSMPVVLIVHGMTARCCIFA